MMGYRGRRKHRSIEYLILWRNKKGKTKETYITARTIQDAVNKLAASRKTYKTYLDVSEHN